jgi:hypothetical protein
LPFFFEVSATKSAILSHNNLLDPEGEQTALEAFNGVDTAARGIDEVARMAARIKLRYDN